jgi:hypothetical protein
VGFLMIIQLKDVENGEYITEFEVNGDVQDAIMVANELTNYVHDSVEYQRTNNKMTLNLEIDVIEIEVKEIG